MRPIMATTQDPADETINNDSDHKDRTSPEMLHLSQL